VICLIAEIAQTYDDAILKIREIPFAPCYSGFHLLEEKSNQRSPCWERGPICPPDSHSTEICCKRTNQHFSIIWQEDSNEESLVLVSLRDHNDCR